jgi:hypothetical protein
LVIVPIVSQPWYVLLPDVTSRVVSTVGLLSGEKALVGERIRYHVSMTAPDTRLWSGLGELPERKPASYTCTATEDGAFVAGMSRATR